MNTDEVGAAFVRLGLAIGRHVPGYVDSYYGPADIAQAIEVGDEISPADLGVLADRLIREVTADSSLQASRRQYLLDEIAAMQTTLRILQGDTPSITEEVRRLYGVTPAWVDESAFAQAHEALAALLRGTEPLAQRVEAFREGLRVPREVAAPMIARLGAEFRELARAKFHLPAQESCEFSFVRDKPWTAYNWYLGRGTSRIEFNEDHPVYIHQLPEIVAHESYPGHHTEHAIKEEKLYRGERRLEHAVLLSNTPSALIAEGIAQNALQIIAGPDETVACYRDLLREAGLPVEEAQRVYEFTLAARPLEKVGDNQILLLYGERASDDEVIAYGVRQGLSTEERQRRLLRFIKDPLWRSYGFNYTLGRDIVASFVSASDDRIGAFTRLLEEPVTPMQLVEA